MFDGREVVARLLEQSADAGMLEGDRRAFRIVLVVGRDQVPPSDDVGADSGQLSNLRKRALSFGGEFLVCHRQTG